MEHSVGRIRRVQENGLVCGEKKIRGNIRVEERRLRESRLDLQPARWAASQGVGLLKL